MRAAWPATRPAHSFFKFRPYALNVLPSGLRFLDGDNSADPLIGREWRNILPFCPRRRVRNENFSQILWYTVYRATGDRFFRNRFHSTPLLKSERCMRELPHNSAIAKSPSGVYGRIPTFRESRDFGDRARDSHSRKHRLEASCCFRPRSCPRMAIFI